MNRLLIINPGSTSTKISIFDGPRHVFTESVFHDAPVLLRYPTTNDQMPFRAQVIRDILSRHDIDISSVTVWVGRGGCACSQPSGVMEINKSLVYDTASDKGGSDHPAKLGVMLAYEFCTLYGGKMYTVNPTNVDELSPFARVTGISGLYRRAQTHTLNQKAIAKIHAESIGRSYDSCSFIVCHIDGGITITAHKNGKMTDSTEGAGGDGPFSLTRLGSIPVMEIITYLKNHTAEELKTMCSRSGGFVSHFGTSNAETVHRLVEKNDEKATLIWNSMIYQICKSIGAMAAVLEGKVDAILLTGGLVRYNDLVEKIKNRCSWIAPISAYPGEVEQEAMANAVLDVLSGKEKAFLYSGKPVFTGFAWDNLG
ncbi:MAG: butyrate kinase [Spirochaetales bacterium]